MTYVYTLKLVDIEDNPYTAIITGQNKLSVQQDFDYRKTEEYEKLMHESPNTLISMSDNIIETNLSSDAFAQLIIDAYKEDNKYIRHSKREGKGSNEDLTCYYIYTK